MPRAAMRESEFQKWVVDTAKSFGWRVWHVPTPMKPIGANRFVPDSRGRGLSDLVMLHEDPPRLIFAELKSLTGTFSVEQREFLRLVRNVAMATGVVMGEPRTVGVYTWRPGAEDIIESILRSKVMVA